NQRDLPRNTPLDRVDVIGTSYEVSVSAEGVEELKRKVKIKGEKKEALLTLRQNPDAPVMRMASAAAKPCQGDSSEFHLIMGIIYTDQRGTLVIATVFDEVKKTLLSISVDYH
ncbi:hypothetical protein Tco_1100697, partial [Tanacetum coccineum]